jgi:hypothetical protein
VLACSAAGQFDQAVALMERAGEFGLAADAFATSAKLARSDGGGNLMPEGGEETQPEEAIEKKTRKWNR